MSKLQLLHVKIFKVDYYNQGLIRYSDSKAITLESDVNDFIKFVYEEYGNYCEVDTNSNFVTVKYNKLTEVNRD